LKSLFPAACLGFSFLSSVAVVITIYFIAKATIMSGTNNTTICSHCGGEIRADARCCPHCGSDEQTGWSSNTYLDGVGLPEDVSYEEIRQNEFGNSSSRHGMTHRRILFMVIASIVIAVFIAATLMVFR
jgi:hypothetical protein